MRIFLLFFLFVPGTLFHAADYAYAQTPSKNDSDSWLKGWSIAPCFLHGKIFKHTPNFKPEIKGPSNAVELNISKQLNGKQEWQQVHHYPSLGIAVAFTNYGNDEVLGHAFSFMPNIDLPLIGSNKPFSLRLRIALQSFFWRRLWLVLRPQSSHRRWMQPETLLSAPEATRVIARVAAE